MAKVPFTKLKLKIEDSIKELQLNDEIVIEVKQYLPIQEKLRLIGDVVKLAHEQDANYSNPIKVEVYRDLEVIFAYTNLNFTEKQKEDLPKLYDTLMSSGMLAKIIEIIPEEEYGKVCMGVWQSIDSVYKYQNSIVGILDTINSDYSNIKFDIKELAKDMQELEDLELLQDLSKLYKQ